MSKICLKNIKSQLRGCLPLQRSSRFAYSLKCSHEANSSKAKNNEMPVMVLLFVKGYECISQATFEARWRIFCLITHRTIKKIKCSLMRLGHSQLRPCLSLNELTLFGFRLINLDYIYRRYSNPVSIRGDKGIGIRSRCLRIAEPHPTNRAKELCTVSRDARLLVISPPIMAHATNRRNHEQQRTSRKS